MAKQAAAQKKKELKRLMTREKTSVPATPRDEAIALAMELSLQEEETRKQKMRELEEAEDEALKLALEASLQLSA